MNKKIKRVLSTRAVDDGRSIALELELHDGDVAVYEIAIDDLDYIQQALMIAVNSAVHRILSSGRMPQTKALDRPGLAVETRIFSLRSEREILLQMPTRHENLAGIIGIQSARMNEATATALIRQLEDGLRSLNLAS